MKFNFIICEDMDFFNLSYQKVIKKVKELLKIDIEIFSFKEFNSDFLKLMNSNLENKIYILDLLMPNIEGTDIAKMIRETDQISFIIFITSYYDNYQQEISDGEYSYLKYINKMDNYEQILFDTLVRNIDKKKRLQSLEVHTQNKAYYIVPHSITQIYTKERRIVIESLINDPINIPISLEKIKSLLPDYFKYSKNCCIVNTRRIAMIDKKTKVIVFDNGTHTTLVSRKYLKNLNLNLKNQKELSHHS